MTVPEAWEVARLDLFAEVKLGKMLSAKARADGLVRMRYLRNENVRWGRVDLDDLKEMGFKPEEIERYSVRPGDLLVCEGGEPGRAAVFTGSESLAYQKALHRVRPRTTDVSPMLLRYWLEYLAMSGKLVGKIAQTTIQHLPLERFEAVEFPLPPSREQDRIVAAIEQHLSRVEAGVDALERLKRELARYRASVLRAACEGRLVPTEAAVARAEGREYEPASVLLDRILVERRARWDRKKKYVEPAAPDTSALSELPEGWVGTSLSQLADLKGGITKGQKRRNGDVVRSVAYLRVANVQRGWLDLSEMKTIEATEADVQDLRLEPGDVLFNEGGDRDKLGRGWVWQGQISECIHQNHVFRARLLGAVNPKFVSWHGNTFGKQWFNEHGKQTTNLASINLTKLGMLPVPLPPLAEQHRIVAEVERRLSIADEVGASVDAALTRAARLRQSILKRAFEGKLVAQDPTDEPASTMLARIRAERERAVTLTPTRRRSKREST